MVRTSQKIEFAGVLELTRETRRTLGGLEKPVNVSEVPRSRASFSIFLALAMPESGSRTTAGDEPIRSTAPLFAIYLENNCKLRVRSETKFF